MAVREKVFTAAAALVTVEIPETLIDQEMERRLHDLAHRLEEQGIGMTIPQYLAVTGQDQTEFVANLREGATEAVRADLALRAVTAQESIAATDEELDAEIEQACRASSREARESSQGSRTEGRARGGTLGHRTREGAGIPPGARRSGRR